MPVISGHVIEAHVSQIWLCALFFSLFMHDSWWNDDQYDTATYKQYKYKLQTQWYITMVTLSCYGGYLVRSVDIWVGEDGVRVLHDMALVR